MNYICHSGGADGSDITWELEGEKYGVKTIAYSFYNHVQKSKNKRPLTVEELNEGMVAVGIANNTLKRRPLEIMYPYVKNLLARNWYQIKNSEAIFAIIAKFLGTQKKIVSGGTGWAVQMAIDNKKPVYVFDQIDNMWNKFNYETNIFDGIDYIPKLTENFAGIGTREIKENGINAIKEVYKHMFMRIYKFNDDKWHLWKINTNNTDCGLEMSSVIEEKKIGGGCEKDPDISTACPKCFSFLKK